MSVYLEPYSGSSESRIALGSEIIKVLGAYGFKAEPLSPAARGIRAKSGLVVFGKAYSRSLHSGYGIRVYSGLSVAGLALLGGEAKLTVVPTWLPRQGEKREVYAGALDATLDFTRANTVSAAVDVAAQYIQQAYVRGTHGFASPRNCTRCGAPTFTTMTGKTGVCADICWEQGVRPTFGIDWRVSIGHDVHAQPLPVLQIRKDGTGDYVDEQHLADVRIAFKHVAAQARAIHPESLAEFVERARACHLDKYGRPPADTDPASWLEAARLAVRDVQPFDEEDLNDMLDLLQ